MWRPSEPSVSLASKGLVSLDITVEGAASDLHSGRYGGTVVNPVHVLCRILASLHDPDGTVAVDGFYDGIPELTASRRDEIADRKIFEEKVSVRGSGLAETHGERGYSTLERLWERPTLDVNGIAGRRQVHRDPARRERRTCRVGWCRARIRTRCSTRSPRTSRPRRNVRGDGHGPAGRRRGCRLHDPGRPPRDPGRPPRSRRSTPARPCCRRASPGTLPATELFERALGVKTLFFSFSTADEKLHAPNEFLRHPAAPRGHARPGSSSGAC